MENELRQLQLTQLEILKIVDAFCRQHGIRYSLYAGTLLGAVRHQGFIPWDDDLDICMDRSEYERFINAWENEPVPGYILQNKENTPTFTQTFTKIRKDHTTFLQEEWERGLYHTGIFIDIFPVDRIPNGFLPRLLFRWNSLCYLLLTREFVPPKGNLLVKTVAGVVLSIYQGEKRQNKRKKLGKQITRYQGTGLQRVTTETFDALFNTLDPELMDKFVMMPYEGNQFPCIEKAKDYLMRVYSDYMTLPPESERTWKHHPIILDFEHNLEELTQE